MGNIENKNRLNFRFDLKSFLLFLFILVIEVLIALFVRDTVIRPYGGDVLVVLLMYYFFKAFIRVKPLYLVLFVLLLAYVVETAQYLNLISILGWENNRFLRIIIGTSFSWGDMLCYTIGAIICLWIDRKDKS